MSKITITSKKGGAKKAPDGIGSKRNNKQNLEEQEQVKKEEK